MLQSPLKYTPALPHVHPQMWLVLDSFSNTPVYLHLHAVGMTFTCKKLSQFLNCCWGISFLHVIREVCHDLNLWTKKELVLSRAKLYMVLESKSHAQVESTAEFKAMVSGVGFRQVDTQLKVNDRLFGQDIWHPSPCHPPPRQQLLLQLSCAHLFCGLLRQITQAPARKVPRQNGDGGQEPDIYRGADVAF